MAKGHFLYKFNYLLAKNIIVYVNIQIGIWLNVNIGATMYKKNVDCRLFRESKENL